MARDAEAADVIIGNGRIYTVDRARPWVSALAVKAGRIIALGGDAEMKAVTGAGTRVVDLGGSMAMPGIVDVHTHIMMGGQAELYETRFPSTLGVAEICARVAQAASNAVEGSWIVGGQWGVEQLANLNTAAALAALDAASGDHPVLLRDETYHNRWVNSAALRIAGVTRDTADPDKGEIGRDPASGALTGVMIEAASGIVERALAASGHYTDAMDRAALSQSIAVLNSFGVTAFLDAASMQPILAALKQLDDRGELTAWAVAAMPAIEPSFMFGLAGDELFALRETYRGAHVRPDYAKIFLDGVPGAKTAAFHDAYTPDPIHGCCFRGATMLTVPDLVRLVGKCERQNIAVKIHCAGDAAVSQALDAVDVVRSFNGPTALVHHIAHASYIRTSDIPRFAQLGVAADLSPIIWYPTVFLEAHKMAMGEERATRFWPNRSLHESGALIGGGSDWPVIPNPDPWDGIEGMVTRQNPKGDFAGVALWPEQALDLATVIETYTISAARMLGLGRTIGSLEIGKSADIIVLDRNVFEIPATDIAETRVITTFFEGRVVYQRD
ncbi:MAG: amidohydrolase [Xanthobacteraceae bacterium]|nr:amidohydrolase [Xanthobacteraceae bacterium]